MGQVKNISAKIIVFSLLFFSLGGASAFANITLRVVAANPSETTSQSVPIKVYLPVEVKPEDILYKEDLEVAYDTQQGSYYVFGEYELEPSEILEKEIEIKDVWLIEEAQILALRKEAKDVFAAFQKAGYAEKAAPLYQSVEKKLSGIEEQQRSSANNPAQHISNYRYLLSQLNSAKADLLASKTLLAEITPKALTGLTWKLIVFIIVFLGVLGLGFYIVLQRQARLEQEQKSPEEPPEPES